LVEELRGMLAHCVERPVEEIASVTPLFNLGLDSMQSISLRSLLKKRYTLPLPQLYALDPQLSLDRIAQALSRGTAFNLVAVSLAGWEAVTAANKFAKLATASTQRPAIISYRYLNNGLKSIRLKLMDVQGSLMQVWQELWLH
jgi:aryl carrier-like protein